MTFLPVAERELRVAARKRSTFWLRVVAALVAAVIGASFLALTLLPFPFGGFNVGKGLFNVLTWLSFAAAALAGPFLTSDCLSEEKREGTLGFLFLTELGGHDVVLGKLLATSLRAFNALLAVFPVLAVTLLMGAVTGAQLWKTSLGVVNVMFVSVAAGLLVSAISREGQRALTATLLLMLLWVAGGPAVDGAIAAWQQRAFVPRLSLSSPGYLFVTAGTWGSTPYWPALLVNQGLAWLCLGLTCLLLPRTWQERQTASSQSGGDWAYVWRYGRANPRRALRRRLIESNPVLWLACRERWQGAFLWLVAMVLAGGLAAAFLFHGQWWWAACSPLSSLITLAIYLGIASQAGRLFVEAQRNGLLELLLVTPLTARRIVQGQARALLRVFGVPLALCLVIQLFCSLAVQQQVWGRIGAVPVTVSPPPVTPMGTNVSVVTNATTVTVTTMSATGVTAVSTSRSFIPPGNLIVWGISILATLTVVANLVALTWFGMWMGLTSNRVNVATLKTILFVQVIPWFGISFVSVIVVSLLLLLPRFLLRSVGGPAQIMTWYPVVLAGTTTLLSLGKDLGLVLWARRRLYSQFRERASWSRAPLRPVAPSAPG